MTLTPESAARKDRTSGNTAELQHRHFAFIAATLKTLHPGMVQSENGKGALKQRQDIVELFADACAATNPKFDHKRFLAACVP